MSNSRIAEIEEMQERLRKKAEEAHEKGDLFSYGFFQALTDLLENDTLFAAPPELLRVYRDILEKGEIEINGMKRPIVSLISSTSNEVLGDKPWWQTAGGSKALRYFQDFVIDAIVDITGVNDEYTENTRLFLAFLKTKGVKDIIYYCDTLAEIMAGYAASSSPWIEKVYENTLFLKLGVELAESLSEVKKSAIIKS